MTSKAFSNTGTILRLILRRDRIRLPVWIVVITVFVAGSAAALPSTYPTATDRQDRAELMSNPAMSVVAGPGFGLDDYTFGAMLSNEMIGFTLIAVALMSIFLVVRHTRTEEESGRAELLRSTPLGRHATLAATLIVTVVANLLLGVLLTLSLIASIDTLSFEGSLLFGAAIAITGIVFASFAGVAAQLSPYGRTATGMSLGFLGAVYILRAVGDAGASILSWLSPIGWAQQTGPYVLDRWWPLALSLTLSLALGGLAFWLSTRRDVGAGMLSSRPGSARASDQLTSPIGLAVRLQRGSLVAWFLSLLLAGLFIGSMLDAAAEFFADNPAGQELLEQIGAASVIDSMIAVYMLFLALVVAVQSVGAINNLRSEETSGHAESLLASAISRLSWAGAYLAYALVSSVLLLTAAGLGAGISHAGTTGDANQIFRLLGATLIYTPAVWIVAGLSMLIFGLAPRAMALVWVLPAYAVFVSMFGPLLQLPGWTYDISPFEQTPKYPADEVTIVPLIILTTVAAILIVIGVTGFRRRDISTA